MVLGGGNALTDSATLAGGSEPDGHDHVLPVRAGRDAKVRRQQRVYTDVVTISGNGTYTTAGATNPGGYTPTATGTDYWVAIYSGDSNNTGHQRQLRHEPVTITPATPSITTTPGGPVTLGNITISGTKYLDLTGNGFSSDDTPQSGVTINLYRTTTAGLRHQLRRYFAQTTTASNGTYSFTNLTAGHLLRAGGRAHRLRPDRRRAERHGRQHLLHGHRHRRPQLLRL